MLGIDALGHLALAGPTSGTAGHSYSFAADGAAFAVAGSIIGGDLGHNTIVIIPPRIRKAAAKLSGIRRTAGKLYNARIRK